MTSSPHLAVSSLKRFQDMGVNETQYFYYGQSNFASHCHSICGSAGPDSHNLCKLPLETGPCQAYIRRYGFNPQTGRCQLFTYGGCGGNANNFESEQECTTRCGDGVSGRDAIMPYPPLFTQCLKTDNGKRRRYHCHSICGFAGTDSHNLCKLPLETGPCQAYIRRYGFNPQTGRCQLFTYGGCGGNANNFESEQECIVRCGDGAAGIEMVSHLKEVLHLMDPNIQFTMDGETNNQLPFLDLYVRRNATGQMHSTVLKKSMVSIQMLHVGGNRSLINERSFVRNLFKIVKTPYSTSTDKILNSHHFKTPSERKKSWRTIHYLKVAFEGLF
ncbi:unnamed protein product [Schistocephalus solidus]|uniref:Kunitz/Bovine pancreatic trypsin inhibitor domain protein n=1 Tax=Schistocephalus solidus TaxID=70667 RepID=A0A183T1X1_SCHSO|nr:unnamed protein product [Schistocephalus solidus]